MLETCPFPPGSDLANKWHLIKQHTAPVSPHSSTALLDAFDSAHPSPEDEEERLRERRRLSIEEGVDPPPNAQIHTLEATSQNSSLYKLGPKMAPGVGEGLGEGRSLGTVSSISGGLSGIAAQVAASMAVPSHTVDCDSEEDSTTLCLQTRRPKQRHASGDTHCSRQPGPWKVHTQIDYIHCLVPDLQAITALPCYWGVMDRYQAEALLDGRPEGTFLLRDSAQEDYLFSVSFRRYNRSLHARIEQWNHNFSFDAHDPCVFHSSTVTGLLEHYKDPSACMFFEPLLTAPLHRTFPFKPSAPGTSCHLQTLHLRWRWFPATASNHAGLPEGVSLQTESPCALARERATTQGQIRSGSVPERQDCGQELCRQRSMWLILSIIQLALDTQQLRMLWTSSRFFPVNTTHGIHTYVSVQCILSS